MEPSGAPWWWIATCTTATERRRFFRATLRCSTLSIHQSNNYPSEKPPSSLDIHLADGTGDAEYLQRLGSGYRAALAMFQPELVVYVAGADPFCDDQLGGLSLTFDRLMERDRLAIESALTPRL